MIFTLNVCCAIKIFLCIPVFLMEIFYSSLGRLLPFDAEQGGGSQDMGSSVSFLCWLVFKVIWLPIFLFSVSRKQQQQKEPPKFFNSITCVVM